MSIRIRDTKGALRSPATVPADSQYDNTEGRFNIFKEVVIHMREKKGNIIWSFIHRQSGLFPYYSSRTAYLFLLW